mgnify:CR=1 FL=1
MKFIKKIRKKLIIFLLVVIVYWLSITPVVFAQTAWQRGIWYGTGKGGVTCNNLEGGCDLCDAIKVVQNIIQMLFELAFLITGGMIAWGAFVFMTAASSEERVKKGRKIMTSAVIGLVIVLCAWSIINVLLHLLTGQVNFPWHTVEC